MSTLTVRGSAFRCRFVCVGEGPGCQRPERELLLRPTRNRHGQEYSDSVDVWAFAPATVTVPSIAAREHAGERHHPGSTSRANLGLRRRRQFLLRSSKIAFGTSADLMIDFWVWRSAGEGVAKYANCTAPAIAVRSRRTPRASTFRHLHVCVEGCMSGTSLYIRHTSVVMPGFEDRTRQIVRGVYTKYLLSTLSVSI